VQPSLQPSGSTHPSRPLTSLLCATTTPPNPQRDEEGSSAKKPRVVWSVEMHQQFVAAVNQLGIDSEWWWGIGGGGGVLRG